LLDAGIGMANVSAALIAFGRTTDWELLNDEPEYRALLGLPDDRELVARVALPRG